MSVTTHLIIFWSLTLPALFVAIGLLFVGVIKGVRDGRLGEAFLFTRPYRKWGFASIGVIILDGIGVLVWLATLPA